jgi:diamine N-acetyltransferase
MSIIIKKASVQDAEHISHLGRVTFTETFGQLFPISEELETYLNETFAVEKIQASISKQNNIFWLAWSDDIPVGYAKLKIKSWYDDAHTEGVSQLQKIYVLQSFLDKTVGKSLYEYLEKEALHYGANELWLVVLHTNNRAIRFYEKTGFVKIKKHFHTIGSQNFEFELMSKKYNSTI